MKKKPEWMTKKEKRNRKKQDRGIVDFMKITHHFFRQMNQWIEEMKDPRHQSYITYTQSDFLYLGILKNVCSLHSMREMEANFNEEACVHTLKILSGNETLEEIPHSDTLNYYLERLSPACLSELRRKMITSLVRGKQFYKSRLLGEYWRVILDGTGLFYFKEKHCENCLRETHKDETGKVSYRYYHKVVEAKLYLSENVILSIGTEFIENERETVEKQDCEINAAKRLLSRLKKEYPRMKFCIQGDALYATEPMMELCRKKGWEYLFTQKESRQKLLGESYEWIRAGEKERRIKGLCKEEGSGYYANHVEEMAGKKEIMNLYEYQYQNKGGKKIEFQWVTGIEVTKRNLEELIKAGRERWKIENEGFNNQKHGLYRIEHLNSRNKNAMKNHYLLTQIADILMQLYLAWSFLLKEIDQSKKNTSSRLLESFRRQTVTDEDVQHIRRYTSVYLE